MPTIYSEGYSAIWEMWDWTCLSRRYYYSSIMASEWVLRRIERLLDKEEAADQGDWRGVHKLAQDGLRLDPETSDALAYLAAAEREQRASATQYSRLCQFYKSNLSYYKASTTLLRQPPVALLRRDRSQRESLGALITAASMDGALGGGS